VISLTSPGFDAAFGTETLMPYLAETLRPQGALLEDYTLLDDHALPNLIAMTGGQHPNELTKQDCPTYREFASGAAPDEKGYVAGDGCIYPVLALSVADQIGAAGLSWRAYMEGMADESGPANCVRPTPNEPDETASTTNGEYAASHNPFAYWHSLIDLGACSSNDVPIEELAKDLRKASSTPSYSYIAPNLCHSGVEDACGSEEASGAVEADAYLSKLVPRILKSPGYREGGLIIVTFSELAGSVKGGGDPVGTVVVSDSTTPGATLTGEYDPYSLLRTTEDIFGLSPLAAAGSADSFVNDIVNGGD
jgi:hypothetical protein